MARRKRGGGGDAPPAGAPAWMMTYGDLVTQVLAFFVLLYSFSSVNAEKFQQMAYSLQNALGMGVGVGEGVISSSGGSAGVINTPHVEADTPSEDRQLKDVRDRIDKAATEGGFKEDVQFSLDERGLTLRFADSALFDSGEAQLKPEAAASLDKVLAVLKDIQNPIRVEGHTDNVPIATIQYPSNWELSGARASRVVRYFIEQGLAQQRLSVAGYGEYRPVATNETAEGRSHNRRVDIVVLSLRFASEQEPR